MKTDGKIWEYINRERGKGKRMNEQIKMEEWRENFLDVLGRVE